MYLARRYQLGDTTVFCTSPTGGGTAILRGHSSQEKDLPAICWAKAALLLLDYCKTLVVYHLQNASGKSGWKVNGTRLFRPFERNLSGINGTSDKVVLFFRTEFSKRRFVFHFFKAIDDTSFRSSRSFFGKCNWFCANGKRDSGKKFTSPEFCLPSTVFIWLNAALD